MLQCLNGEVGHHAPVFGVHPRAVGVEDTGDLDPHIVLALVVEDQRLAASRVLIAARPRPERVDIAAVILGLRMDFQIAIDLDGWTPAAPSPRPVWEDRAS